MESRYKVAGYVKLAKWWEKSSAEAIAYHRNYYTEKIAELDQAVLVDVYIDITGQKHIAKRKEMLRLLQDCRLQKINCIAVQTKAYLAANHQEFCFLLHYLFSLENRVEILTEDDKYHIDTIADIDGEREALCAMAEAYVSLDTAAYEKWLNAVMQSIDKHQDAEERR